MVAGVLNSNTLFNTCIFSQSLQRANHVLDHTIVITDQHSSTIVPNLYKKNKLQERGREKN
jgi:hypothetical protein